MEAKRTSVRRIDFFAHEEEKAQFNWWHSRNVVKSPVEQEERYQKRWKLANDDFMEEVVRFCLYGLQ